MNRYALWAFRLIAAAILIYVGYLKLSMNPHDVEIFTKLEMEPHGRIIIGFIELASGLLLLSPQAALGGLFGVGVMSGAIIAHATVLGFSIPHVPLLALVLASCAVVVIAKRRDLPIIGKSLGGQQRTLP